MISVPTVAFFFLLLFASLGFVGCIMLCAKAWHSAVNRAAHARILDANREAKKARDALASAQLERDNLYEELKKHESYRKKALLP